MAKFESKKKDKKNINVIKFPAWVLKPVKEFLLRERQRLEAQKHQVNRSDPFYDHDRTIDNAANDAEAQEQFGHETANALRRQLDLRLIQIKKALTRLKLGHYGSCEKCGKMIDTDRLTLMPETTLCAKCAQKKEN